MQPNRDTYSAEDCMNRHRTINRMQGVILTLIGLIAIFIGWAGVAANCAREDAVNAASAASILGVKNDEYRNYMKQDMIDMKQSIRSISEKQDRMNESIQRLIQKTETK